MGLANLVALLSCGIAMGLGALGSGWALGFVAQAAVRASARQPEKRSEIFRNMLVGQAITETPAIFSLVVAFLLFFAADSVLEAPNSLAQCAVYMGSGLAIGIGAIGSGIGSGLVAHEAIDGAARNPGAQSGVVMLMLVGQAWAQTGGIFALVVALFLLNAGGMAGLSTPDDYRLLGFIPLSGGEAEAFSRHLGAGIAMGAGAIGSSLGIAFNAGAACRCLADHPPAAARVKTAFFIGSATAQSPSVFSLIIALILLIG